MANLMKMKRSSVPGKVPATTDLDLGEIAINTYDGKAYIKKNVSGAESVVPLGGGAGTGDVTGPASSTDNAIARFDGTSGKVVKNSGATIDDNGNVSATSVQASGTGANKMPVGTTAQRPAAPVTGEYRMNSTNGKPEWWDANLNLWTPFGHRTYQVEYIVVAGGGSGGGSVGGGGGAGGVISGSMEVHEGSQLAVIVGAGGSAVGQQTGGNSGSNSSLSNLVAIGGGGGASSKVAANVLPAKSGGSGGGGSAYVDSGGTTTGGSGTTGQGNRGGDAPASATITSCGAGGGGAGAVGGNGTNSAAGAGGIGVQSSITGTATYYAGGGGGGGYNYIGGAAGAGGSGVVIIRYLGVQRAFGGTVTSSGGYTIHTFTTSGTFST